MLEDDFTYVLRKALLGNGLAPGQAARLAGLSETDVLAFSRGAFSAEYASGLARVLGLNPAAFAAHPSYQPRPLDLAGVTWLDLPFGNERVNSWLVEHRGAKIVFDAGYESGDLMRELASRGGEMPERGFITHSHRDHLGGLAALLEAGVRCHAAEIPGTILMKPGDSIGIGKLVITACDLSGHAMPALGFHVSGLGKPLLVVGDALFAGSIGGCGSPPVYQHALRTLREALSPLPDDTVLLTGHGPPTTLGEERQSNPFIAGSAFQELP